MLAFLHIKSKGLAFIGIFFLCFSFYREKGCHIFHHYEILIPGNGTSLSYKNFYKLFVAFMISFFNKRKNIGRLPL